MFLTSRLAYWRYAIPFSLAAGAIYLFFRLYQSKWRFASLPDLVAIAKASAVLALAMLVIDYVVLAQNLYGGYFFGRQAIAIYFGVQMALLGGPRLLYRYWKDSRAMSSPSRREDAPTILLGRPSDIEVLLRAIETGAVRNMRPVAILSSREIDLGQVIRGVKVTGDFNDLEDEVEAAKARNAPIRRIVMTPAALAPESEPERCSTRPAASACRCCACSRWRAPRPACSRPSTSRTCCCGRAMTSMATSSAAS